MALKSRVNRIRKILRSTYPEVKPQLYYGNAFELLVATILSAQCTDAQVNRVTPRLFEQYKSPADFAGAPLKSIEKLIRSTGFFRNKARNLIACAQVLVEQHGGDVPQKLDSLVALPGVGRKTANVVLGNAFDIPGMVVDTHVKRIVYRLGWSRHSDPEKVERDLMKLLPDERWNQTSHTLIHHGRAICKAPTPLCSVCPLQDGCPRNGVMRSK